MRGERRGEERRVVRGEVRGEESSCCGALWSAVHRGERREEEQQQERQGSVAHSGSFNISLAFSMTSGSLKEASISPIFSGLAANASHSCRRERAGARTRHTIHTIERERKREGSVR